MTETMNITNTDRVNTKSEGLSVNETLLSILKHVAEFTNDDLNRRMDIDPDEHFRMKKSLIDIKEAIGCHFRRNPFGIDKEYITSDKEVSIANRLLFLIIELEQMSENIQLDFVTAFFKATVLSPSDYENEIHNTLSQIGLKATQNNLMINILFPMLEKASNVRDFTNSIYSRLRIEINQEEFKIYIIQLKERVRVANEKIKEELDTLKNLVNQNKF